MAFQSEYAVWQADLARKPRRPFLRVLIASLMSWRK